MNIKKRIKMSAVLILIAVTFTLISMGIIRTYTGGKSQQKIRSVMSLKKIETKLSAKRSAQREEAKTLQFQGVIPIVVHILKDEVIAYDSINNVWAFVGKSGKKIYVQIRDTKIDGTPGENVLAQKCISDMIHTPKIRSTEDYIVASFFSNPKMDITNPSISYTFANPKIVYNPKTRTFLVIWTQISREDGQQEIAQVVNYDRSRNIIGSWQEPRVISELEIKNLKITKDEIIHKDIDIDRSGENPWAVIALTVKRGKDRMAQIRYMPMYLYANGYSYKLTRSEKYFLKDSIWKGPGNAKLKSVSASLSTAQETNSSSIINILYVVSINAYGSTYDGLRIWRCYENLQSPSYITDGRTFESGSINDEDLPIIRKRQSMDHPVVMYVKKEKLQNPPQTYRYQLRIVTFRERPDVNPNYVSRWENIYIGSLHSYENYQSIRFNPQIFLTDDSCLLTIQRQYILNNETNLKCDYILYDNFSINNSLTLADTKDISYTALASIGEPEARKNKGIVYNPDTEMAVCYWHENSIGTAPKNLETGIIDVGNITSIPEEYSPNFMHTGTAFSWDPYSDGNPLYSVYVVTEPNGEVYNPQNINVDEDKITVDWVMPPDLQRFYVFICMSGSGIESPRLLGPMSYAQQPPATTQPPQTEPPTQHVDSDRDGLDDSQELIHGTNPGLADTDSDGVSDFAEVMTYLTNPLSPDTDGDGLSDGDEINIHHTDPLTATSLTRMAGVVATVSSFYRMGAEGFDQAAPMAIDGNMDTIWSCDGPTEVMRLGGYPPKPSFRLDFPSPCSIHTIKLYGKSDYENILSFTLTFSDGSTEFISQSLDTTGQGTSIYFDAAKQNIMWIILQATNTSGENPGLREFEVYKN